MKTNLKALAILMIAVTFFAGCKPEEPNNGNGNETNTAVPKVKTTDVFDVSYTNAYGGGEIISEGSSAVVEQGLCWSMTTEPTLNDNYVQDTLGNDVFTCLMDNLEKNTTYYVRAYAINGDGIGYGNQVEFSTLEAPAPFSEDGFVGNWGVERIDYYNTDCYGNPIPNTIETLYFTPGDSDNGIEMVFREDRTGEMRDSSKDSLYVDGVFVLCPDTTVVTPYTYSYSENDSILYMEVQSLHPVNYQMSIPLMTEDYYIFVNEYSPSYIEKAYLRRLSFVPESRSANMIVSDWPSKGPLLMRR
jgi:hypothetical protein